MFVCTVLHILLLSLLSLSLCGRQSSEKEKTTKATLHHPAKRETVRFHIARMTSMPPRPPSPLTRTGNSCHISPSNQCSGTGNPSENPGTPAGMLCILRSLSLFSAYPCPSAPWHPWQRAPGYSRGLSVVILSPWRYPHLDVDVVETQCLTAWLLVHPLSNSQTRRFVCYCTRNYIFCFVFASANSRLVYNHLNDITRGFNLSGNKFAEF